MSVSFILLSTTPTATTASFPATTWDPRLLHAIEEATKWIDTSESVEKKAPKDLCNAPPSLSYLRSHIKHLLVRPALRKGRERKRYSIDEAVEIVAKQPLVYSFYVQNVFQPYRSQLTIANVPSTSFCYLDQTFRECTEHGNAEGCTDVWHTGVCLPNSDTTTEGRCVSCTVLQEEITNGTLKNETTIGYLNDTCDPSPRGPKDAPALPSHPNKIDTRYLRWFLESSFVLEKKKVGDKCTVSQELGKARAYVDVLMRKHFGKRNHNGNVSLTTPGKEGKEDEIAYEAAKADVTDKRKKFFKETLKRIIAHGNQKGSFEEVYCSMEEGLVCMDGSCRDCEDEKVKKNEDLMADCNLMEEGRGRRGEKGDGEKKGEGEKKNSSGAQEGRRILKLTTILGICASTIFEMFWW
jgi:hypothetical protein